MENSGAKRVGEINLMLMKYMLLRGMKILHNKWNGTD
jgi:hypothetical protein